jgi:hypothetical protein
MGIDALVSLYGMRRNRLPKTRIYHAVLFLLICSLNFELQAQQYTKVDVSLGSESHTYSGQALSTGWDGVIDYNFSASISAEGSIGYLPLFQKSQWQDSGSELVGIGGLKFGRRSDRVSIYGKIEPGLASFSCGLSYYSPPPLSNPYSNCQRRTHFALQYGGVVEYKLKPRLSVRVDVAQTLLAEFDQVLARYEGGAESGTPESILDGHVAQHLEFRFLLDYNLGKFHAASPERSPAATKMNVGLLYTLQPKVHLLQQNLEPDSGVGAWLDFNIAKYLSWDTSALYFQRDDNNMGYQDGGSSVDTFSGIKAGVQKGRVGVFGKIRPGTIVFGRTVDSFTQAADLVSVTYSKFVTFGLDTGVVVEVYPIGRAILRAEAGEVSIFYPSKVVHLQSGRATVPGLERSAVMITFGVGRRF